MYCQGAIGMNNRDRKRSEIVEKGSEYLLEKGLYDFSLRPFAQSLGTSDRMVLHYFSGKEELLYLLLSNVMERTLAAAAQGAGMKITLNDFLDALPSLLSDAANKRFFRIWLELCTYKDGRLDLSEEFIDALFAMFKRRLESLIDFKDAMSVDGLVSFLIVLIEGSLVVGSYGKDEAVRNSLQWLKALMGAQA